MSEFPQHQSPKFANGHHEPDDESSDENELRSQFPELYAQMLIANERISNVGTLAIWILAAADLILCVGIHKGWVANVGGIPIAQFQSWGVYVLLSILAVIAFSVYTSVFEKRAYQQSRHTIESGLRQARKSGAWLLAQINDDDALSSLAEQMRGDASLVV